MTATDPDGTPKYAHTANLIRARIADGTLKPGDPAPTRAELARTTGYNRQTCARALWTLIHDGTLTLDPGPALHTHVTDTTPPPPDTPSPGERDSRG